MSPYFLKFPSQDLALRASEAIKLFPKTVIGGGWQPTAVYIKCRARAYYDKGDIRSAIADLMEAMRRDPTGKWSIIASDLRAIGPSPLDEGWGHKQALATLADICAKSGDYDNAAKYQKEFMELLDLTEGEIAEGRKSLARFMAHAANCTT